MSKPEGRPPFKPTDRDRTMVKVMVAGGIQQEHIAAVLGISARTMRKHFRVEIRTGLADVQGRVVASLVTMATTGRNFHAAKWYTQAMMGWSEKVSVEGQDVLGFGKLLEVLEARRQRSN